MQLLEEAVAKAGTVIEELRPDLPEAERASIAHAIGIGGVKYADLSTAHDSDYTFDLDRMLALTGNTAPYLQYAVARIRSIQRKAAEQDRKSTRLNSSHVAISYAVFCLKKKR